MGSNYGRGRNSLMAMAEIHLFWQKWSISTNRFQMSHFRSLNVTRRSPVIAKDYSHSNRINSISFAPLYLNFILSKNYKKMLSKPYEVYFIPNVN